MNYLYTVCYTRIWLDGIKNIIDIDLWVGGGGNDDDEELCMLKVKYEY